MQYSLKPSCTIVGSCVFKAACPDIHNYGSWLFRQDDMIYHSIIKINLQY